MDQGAQALSQSTNEMDLGTQRELQQMLWELRPSAERVPPKLQSVQEKTAPHFLVLATCLMLFLGTHRIVKNGSYTYLVLHSLCHSEVAFAAESSVLCTSVSSFAEQKPSVMATQSHWKMEQKQLLGEVPPGPKIEVASDHGDVCGAGDPDTLASAPRVLSDLSGSSGAATAGSSLPVAAGVISISGDDPGQPFLDTVQVQGPSDVQGAQSSHTYPICVVLKKGEGIQTTPESSAAAVVQATRGNGPVGGCVSQTPGPGNGTGKKQSSWAEAAQVQKPVKCYLIPEYLEPQKSVPLPPSSPTAQPSSGGGHFWASLGCQASRPGPALRSHTKPPGPAVCLGAPEPGPDVRCRESRRGPLVCRRAPEPGPDARRRGSRRAHVVGRRVPEPGTDRRRRRAPEPRAAVLRPAAEQGPDGSRRAPEPASAAAAPPSPALPPAAADPSQALPPAAADPSQALPPAAADPSQALPPAAADPSRPLPSAAADPSRPLPSAAADPNRPLPSAAAAAAAAAQQSQVLPSAARQRASGGRASGLSPALRSCDNHEGPALQSSPAAPGFVLQSRPTQRATPISRPSLPGRAVQGLPPSPGCALRRLIFQSSSSSSDAEGPSVSPQGIWHAVRMRASSPSPPGRLFPFQMQGGGESSSSSSSSSAPSSPGSVGHSPFSSGQSASSSTPARHGLATISTPSPASLRRALLPDLEVLSPLSSDEPNEIGSTPPRCSSPICDLP
ncbi:EZH inhibitory protein [Galemys pyrenaicus]|uniref:EZH inhibitory protein n=1 Tax=Galemys pyrenaicus TaxID=202257 RepID=A0A8J6AEW5_GALPY|nr:EZH inhibitory protein [Galemys pyrenaicus]